MAPVSRIRRDEHHGRLGTQPPVLRRGGLPDRRPRGHLGLGRGSEEPGVVCATAVPLGRGDDSRLPQTRRSADPLGPSRADESRAHLPRLARPPEPGVPPLLVRPPDRFGRSAAPPSISGRPRVPRGRLGMAPVSRLEVRRIQSPATRRSLGVRIRDRLRARSVRRARVLLGARPRFALLASHEATRVGGIRSSERRTTFRGLPESSDFETLTLNRRSGAHPFRSSCIRRTGWVTCTGTRRYVPARTGPVVSRRARAVSIERAMTAQKTRNIHPYPRNRRSAVFNWYWDAAKPSDPGSIAPAAKANRSAIAIGPATLGAAAVRATSTRARSTRRAFRSSFRVRAAVRAADNSTRVPVTSISIPGGAPGTGVARVVSSSSTSSSLGGIILIASAVTRVASPTGNRSASGIAAMRRPSPRRASSRRPTWLTAAAARAIATTMAPTRESAYVWAEIAADNPGAVVHFAVHIR